jgi:predicted TIM-barrel fold metal-dependent hydrolase
VIIEWHTHVYPPEEAAASPLWGGRCPMTVENVLAAHHKAGLAVSVVSNAAHYLRGKDAKDELKAVARWSDYAAEIQNAHKGTLYCLAMATPCGGPAHLKELERAIRDLGLKGVLINSSHKGHYPDDDEARGFWELVQDLDIRMMIHPPHVGFGEERMKDMLVRNITPPGQFGKVFGFVTSGFNVAGVMAPFIYGPLLDSGNPRAVFLAIGAGRLLTVLLIGWTRKRR